MSAPELHSVPIHREFLDQYIGLRIRILMRNSKQIVGTLLDFDDFINMQLEDVIELESTTNGGYEVVEFNQITVSGENVVYITPVHE